MASFTDRILSYWAFGFLSILFSAVTYGFYHVITKRLTISGDANALPAVYVVLFRQLAILLSSLPSASYHRAPMLHGFTWRQWALLVTRSLAAIIASICAQLAIQRLVLSDFMTILATVPILATLISWPIFRERPRITDAPIFGACLAGVIFIVQPAFLFETSQNYSPPDALGLVLAFSVVAFNISIVTIMRGIREIPVSSIHCVYGAISVAIAIAVNAAFNPGLLAFPPCSLLTRFEMIVIGLLATASLVSDSLASKVLPPGFCALPPVVEILFHIVWQLATAGQQPLFSLVGAALVMAAFCFFGFRAWLLHNKPPGGDFKVPFWYRMLTC